MASREGLDVDAAYRDLVAFQRHVTQASVEKAAVRGRAEILRDWFSGWKESGAIVGDRRYREETNRDPVKESADY